MGPRRINMKGQKFNRLTVVKFSHVQNGNAHWVCSCECGNKTTVSRSSLKRETIKSCGCLRKEIGRKKFLKNPNNHGLRCHPLYDVWDAMKQRCTNPNSLSFRYYGARGISVCDEWINDPVAFIDWAKRNGYKMGLEIDRRNNDGNYCPENCRFVTRKENMNNKRGNKIIFFNGMELTLSQWADKIGITYNSLTGRLNRGWTIQKALSTPQLTKGGRI